jgi:hypothetical protein
MEDIVSLLWRRGVASRPERIDNASPQSSDTFTCAPEKPVAKEIVTAQNNRKTMFVGLFEPVVSNNQGWFP